MLCSGGAEDVAITFIGEESDDAEVGGIPSIFEVDGELRAVAIRVFKCFYFLQGANHVSVLQCFAGIFSGFDIGLQRFFGYGNPEFQGRSADAWWEILDMDIESGGGLVWR